MKTISAIYGCSYCDFTSESKELIGRHESICEHNHNQNEIRKLNKVKEEKLKLRKEMLESSSITELNELLTSYVNTYYPKESYLKLRKSWTEETQQYFYIDGYNLKSAFSYRLQVIGISTNIRDYKKIFELTEKLHEYNKIKSINSKEFKTKLNSFLRTREKTQIEVDLEEQNKQLSLKIDELTKLRNSNNESLEKIQNEIISKFKIDTSFIDYNVLANEISNKLKG